MDPITLILGALLAGATKGVGESATAAVKDAYATLRSALTRKLADRPAADAAVEQFTQEPDAWRSNVEVHLKQAGVGSDPIIVDAATAVMRSADPAGVSAGKYVVNLAGAQGVQVGDSNTQTNYFGAHPGRG